ncbi:MAG: RagB/SusD family protein [Chitinophagaceae bacterium]
MKRKLFTYVVLLLAVQGLMVSCKKAFDKVPGTELDASLAYRNVYDADAAVMGIYGKFMKLADRYVVLNELRGDLLEYTNNADQYLRQLSTHSVTPDNPYANPRPFYELIVNCNDVLKHFTIMYRENKLKEAEYNQRYADIITLRAFLYLQLGIHYGDEVRYVTDPLEDVLAVNDQSRFPKLPFTQLLDSLINSLVSLPYKDPYPAGSTLNSTLDAYPTAKFFVTKKIILADLYLWKGDYNQAATYYRQVMELGSINYAAGAAGYYCYFKLGWNSDGEVDHYVTYSRAGDASTLVRNTQWRVMFEQLPTSNGFNYEWIWVLPFDSKFAPENPLIKLFSPVGGDYLVKPSAEAMDNWNSQKQRPVTLTSSVNGLPYDARGQLSVSTIGGQPVVMKYLYNYLNYATLTPANPLVKNGKWFLFRQTQMHLRFSEAANRAGKHKLAYGLLNSGIAGAFPAPGSDVTLYHNTLSEGFPFNFDARNSGSSGVPYYRADWYRNIGIRARANVTDLPVTASDSLLQIENGIINEVALENAFEGTRWPDLLRIARRRNDPSFLADKIYSKLSKDGVAGAAAARAKLLSKDWYLPFNLK